MAQLSVVVVVCVLRCDWRVAALLPLATDEHQRDCIFGDTYYCAIALLSPPPQQQQDHRRPRQLPPVQRLTKMTATTAPTG